jgi:hypothetical protein
MNIEDAEVSVDKPESLANYLLLAGWNCSLEAEKNNKYNEWMPSAKGSQ